MINSSPNAITLDTVEQHLYVQVELGAGVHELRVYDENNSIIARHRGLDGGDRFYGLFEGGNPLIRYASKLVKLSVLLLR